MAEIDRIGNRASAMMMTLETSPMPNQMMSSGKSASFGIGRVISIGGSQIDFTTSCMPISSPRARRSGC
jgi:hypothetical protein